MAKIVKQNIYENSWLRVHEDAAIYQNGGQELYGVVEEQDLVVIVDLNQTSDVYLIHSINPSSAIPRAAARGMKNLPASGRVRAFT